jgi:hypothetical protein
VEGAARSVPVVRNHFRRVDEVATVVQDLGGDRAKLRVEIFVADSKVCAEVKEIIADRLREIREASLGHQMDARSTADTAAGGGHMMFGYVMPGEAASEEELEAVSQIFMQAKSYSYNPGDVILHRGSLDSCLFHVVSGSALCMFANGQVMMRLGPGEIFGEVSFVDTGDGGASNNVIAENSVECLVLARETMEMVAALHPGAGARFWRRLAVATAFRIRQQFSGLEYRRLAAESACALRA